MNLQITIANKEEAQEAVNMLNAYLGNSSVSAVAAKAVETKEEKVEVKEEPKKTTSKPKTTTKPAAKKVEEPVEDDEEETEDESDESSDEETEASDITLKDLTNIAKEAVERSDRTAAKKVISKYGSKLSEVDEADYAALAKELEALGA